MVLHHHQLKDADAIPILAADDPPLHYDDHHDGGRMADAVHIFPSRRKRHSGNSNEASSSGVTRFVSRRRGRSVPCDTSGGSHMTTTTSSGNNNEYSDPQLAAITRSRAGSAGSALAGSRAARRADGDAILGDSLGAAGGGRRRAATSSILNHFRRRQKEHEHAQNEYRDQDNQQQAAGGRRRKVHFKTMLHTEVMPNPFGSQPTYDELLFNVGGLYQTLSFLHDPFPQEDPTNSSTDSSTQGLDDDLHQPPPPERSMQLMIAEFLYRSAVYLGYPNDSKPWIPGFRETKRFSVNDVKRWRRLAHHDWNKEEEQFSAAVVLVNQHKQQHGHRSHHRRKTSSGIGFRATVSGWLQQRKRRHSAPAKMSLSCPPPVSPSADLTLVVTIANSCVYCGAFQFTARDVFALCNVDIEAQVATATARSV
ncbi:hypothetical protein Gpo141_00000964 [Globisporangium polare]